MWVPSVQRVIEMLTILGANRVTLIPVDNSPGETREGLSVTDEVMETSLENSVHTEAFPVWNITLMVQFLTHCLQKSPLSFSTEDLRRLMLIMCRISLDLRLQSSVFDIQMCIAAILDCFEENQWKEKVQYRISLCLDNNTNEARVKLKELRKKYEPLH